MSDYEPYDHDNDHDDGHYSDYDNEQFFNENDEGDDDEDEETDMLKPKVEVIEEEDEEEEEREELPEGLIEQPEEEEKEVAAQRRVTSNRLTKFERSGVLKTRLDQLNNGANPLIKTVSINDRDIALEEMESAQDQLPFVIERPLPGGTVETVHIGDLFLPQADPTLVSLTK